MKIEYLEKYKNSLYSALSHYEERDRQEGTETVDRLKEEIARAINIITEYPEAFQKEHNRTRARACNLKKFPYSVIYVYQARKKTVQIYNLHHYKQKR